MNIKELASEYLKHFTAVLEDDGSISIKLKDDAPDELKAMVYKTRRGIEPDKYTTEYVRHALLLIAESEGVEDLHTPTLNVNLMIGRKTYSIGSIAIEKGFGLWKRL